MVSDGLTVGAAIAIPYAICFVALLIIAGLVAATQPEPCPTMDGDGQWPYGGVCGYGQAFFFVLTVFHAGTWGHLLPGTGGQVAMICIVSALGYLWPLVIVFGLLKYMKQVPLLQLTGSAFAITYMCLSVVGNLLFAGILSGLESTCGENPCPLSALFYYTWMTFHMRAFGDISPTGDASFAVGSLVAMLGHLCWAIPLLAIARNTVLDPNERLFSSGPNGGFKGLLKKTGIAVLLPYGVFVCMMLVLAGVYEATADIKLGYGTSLLLVWSTFHGAAWGHIAPVTNGQRAVACLAASGGYLWRQIVLVLLLRAVDHGSLAAKFAKALTASYVVLALLGSFILAGINLGVGAGGDYGTSLYYVWMTYHGRSYGDYHPEGLGEDIVAIAVVMIGNLGWVCPLVLVIRASVLLTVVSSVSTGPAPTVIGAA